MGGLVSKFALNMKEFPLFALRPDKNNKSAMMPLHLINLFLLNMNVESLQTPTG